jgi:ribosomal protein L24
MKVGDTVTIIKGHNSVKGRPGKITAINAMNATVQIGGRSVTAPLGSISMQTPAGAAATAKTQVTNAVTALRSTKPAAPVTPATPATPAAPAVRSYGGYSIGDTVTIYGVPYNTTVVTGKVVDFTKYGSMTYVQVKSDTDGKIWSADPNDKDSIRKGAPDKSLHRFEVQVGEVEHSGDEEDAVRQIKKIPGARIVSTQRPYADEYGQEMVIFTVEGPYTAKEFYAKARELGIDL